MLSMISGNATSTFAAAKERIIADQAMVMMSLYLKGVRHTIRPGNTQNPKINTAMVYRMK